MSSISTRQSNTPRIPFTMMCLGNSYSLDALLYVPLILNELCPSIDLSISIMYSPSVPLEYQLSCLNQESEHDTFYEWTNGGPWKTHNSFDLSELLSSRRWDLIILHQVSSSSGDRASLSCLATIIDTLHTRLGQGTKVAWLLTPAYPDGSERLAELSWKDAGNEPMNSDNMYACVERCAKWVLDSCGIDFILPVGTAIQDARHTSIKDIGNGGGLTQDGLHLQDGLPRMIASMAVCQALSNYYNWNIDVRHSAFIIDDISQYVNIGWELRHGRVVGTSPEKVTIGQECAYTAAYTFANP